MSGLRTDVELRRAEFALRAEFDVAPGEVLAVLGPNGAGKSTLLSVLAGQLVPDRGRVELDGVPWLDTEQGIAVPTHRRGVGLLAQNALLFPNLTALENVAFGPRAAGTSKAEAREIAARWLSEVDASELAGRRPGQLSGGQAQRVALARALAAEPKLLLLDEPLAALDVDAAPAMRGLLHQVLGRQEKPTVLVTHDVLDAVVLADRLVVLLDGCIVEQGPTREVLSRPKEPFTARVAGLNLVPGVARENGVEFGETVLSGRIAEDVDQGRPAAAVFAPAAVAVHREPPGGSPRNALRVRLAGLEPRGDVVRVRGVVRDCSLAADITPAAVADLRLSPGDEVWLAVKAAEVAIHPLSGGSSGA
ncbi:molybdate transport system ATP-binding protein [Saccharopolyspora antimicrobica]|uniref:Molybdate transport system ATP-binding protein n=1 Tax=Saccharopolyspora antimicrobica TaxID=455193 RepID=A0A1I5IX78_9PSEU|nr:ATP-binding cassette domain-containing protein [Saccharopolyspora antimicrobica]RKT83746.1 molybdate transport system ATP-binding protein [Saccharopolyspora antimicrobica]SFO64970.1 molybdate transport system ATP-binding protein [Saccharopolyspora antimicrobica]